MSSTIDESSTLSRLDGLPPFPVVLLYSLVDLSFLPFGSSTEWRRWLPASTFSVGWFLSEEYRVPWEGLVPDYSTVSFSDFVVSQQEDDIPWYGLLYKYAFQTSSTSLTHLSSPEALTVLLVLIMVLRYAKKHLIMPFFHQVGHEQALKAHGADWIAENAERLTKVGEYAFRLLFHTSMSVYGIWAFSHAEWWRDPSLCFRGWPKQHDIPPSLLWYYMIQGAYNLDALVSLLELSLEIHWQWPIQNNKSDSDKSNKSWWLPLSISKSKTVRGDFHEMMAHHLVTNGLVFASWGLRFMRVGSMVFLLHDISDVPVDLSKLAHFMKYKVATACCFFTMLVAWFVTRLVIMPFVIFKATFWDAHYALQDPDLHPMTYRLLQPMFCVGLALLIALHAFWFSMFLRMLAAMVMEKKLVDYTVDKNGEEAVEYEGGKEATTRTKVMSKVQ